MCIKEEEEGRKERDRVLGIERRQAEEFAGGTNGREAAVVGVSSVSDLGIFFITPFLHSHRHPFFPCSFSIVGDGGGGEDGVGECRTLIGSSPAHCLFLG